MALQKEKNCIKQLQSNIECKKAECEQTLGELRKYKAIEHERMKEVKQCQLKLAMYFKQTLKSHDSDGEDGEKTTATSKKKKN